MCRTRKCVLFLLVDLQFICNQNRTWASVASLDARGSPRLSHESAAQLAQLELQREPGGGWGSFPVPKEVPSLTVQVRSQVLHLWKLDLLGYKLTYARNHPLKMYKYSE